MDINEIQLSPKKQEQLNKIQNEFAEKVANVHKTLCEKIEELEKEKEANQLELIRLRRLNGM